MIGGIELGRMLAGEKHSPVVYFVWCAGAVKIGTTTRLVGRVGSLYLRMVDVIMIIPGGRPVERAYHERLRDHRIMEPGRRELFDLDAVLRELSITWKRPGPARLDYKRSIVIIPIKAKPVTDAHGLPPVTLVCRYEHSFITRARGASAVSCPTCRKDGRRVSVWVPAARPVTYPVHAAKSGETRS